VSAEHRPVEEVTVLSLVTRALTKDTVDLEPAAPAETSTISGADPALELISKPVTSAVAPPAPVLMSFGPSGNPDKVRIRYSLMPCPVPVSVTPLLQLAWD